jgi:hypothetical protein
MANDMSWKTNITCALGKAQQRLFYLRKLKKKFPQGLMVNFYHCAVESVVTYGLLVWFSSCTRAEKEATVFTSRCLRRVNNILQDPFHPVQHLFEQLPSGRRYCSLRSRTNRLTSIHRLSDC